MRVPLRQPSELDDRVAAPAGPWTVEHYTDGGVETFSVESDAGPVCVLTEDPDREQRAEIVAAPWYVAVARAALPALSTEVRRLRGADRPVVIDPAQ